MSRGVAGRTAATPNGGITLSWPHKDRLLVADGTTSYRWVPPRGAPLPPTSTSLGVVGEQPSSNIVVCGDGLDVLSEMGPTAAIGEGSVRLVYIDPPFNTGKGFGDYDDALASGMWLSMLRDRLVAVRPYLAEDASIWVHLDDSETHRARVILDEVFGQGAFVSTVIWQKRTTRESRAAFSNNHDCIHVYAPAGPRAWKKRRNLLSKDAADLTNRDNDPRGPWADAPFTAPGFRRNQQYTITTPTGRTLHPPRGRSWYATEPAFQQLLADDRIWFPSNGNGSPRLKLFLHQIRGLVPFSVWSADETGTNDDAKRHLQALFPDADAVFATPKPEQLLERIIHVATDPGELVLDMFAGSGTTAAVAHKMGRTWVAIERSPTTVANVLVPRLTAVVTGTDPRGASASNHWTGGGGFTVAQVKPGLGRVANVALKARSRSGGKTAGRPASRQAS